MPTQTITPERKPEKAVYNKDTKAAEFSSDKAYKSVCVIFAGYKDGKLENVSVKRDEEIAVGANSIRLERSFDDSGEIKVYIWESLRGMKPMLLYR